MPDIITADCSRSNPTYTTVPEVNLDTVGIEFEVPLMGSGPEGAETAAQADRLYSDARDEYNQRWPHGGRVQSEHTGIEIPSEQLDLHDDPTAWYRSTIQTIDEMGYEFVPTGYGQDQFGLHHHISQLEREKAEAFEEVAEEPWLKVFCCTSINRNSADPWRHYGHRLIPARGRRGQGHYEWRLPEPMEPEQHELVIEFLRTMETVGAEEAIAFAKEKVETFDQRLGAINRYETLAGEYDNWPDEQTVTQDRNTDPELAHYMIDLMGDDRPDE